jgi:ABC-type molybdate transport system substrate-binding protein
MSDSNLKQLIVGAASAVTLMAFSVVTCADDTKFPPHGNANINLAVASNFYGVPPSNSAITDIINTFVAENPKYTVTVVDNGATSDLENRIINGNQLKVDLFLAADTETPLDLVTNHFDLVAPYNNSFRPPLYTFNYAQGVLAFLGGVDAMGNGVDVTCETGSCGYDASKYKTVAIANPSLAPYGVAAQSVLIGRYDLVPPLETNSLVVEYGNITLTLNAVLNGTNPVGFVAMSAICSNGSFPTQGTSALPYFTSEASITTPPVLINNYNPLTQAGISIRNRRTPAQNTELEAFVAFLTDFTSPPTPDSPTMTTLKKYCYNAP